jgi:hypothetical protein
MKTNREKNMEHQAKQDTKVRPKPQPYQFTELQAIVNGWIKDNV